MLSDDDINLLVAAQALELAARDIYAIVVSRKSKSDDEQGLLALMHSHHAAYGQTLNGVLGKRAATERDNDAYTKFLRCCQMQANFGKHCSSLRTPQSRRIR